MKPRRKMLLSDDERARRSQAMRDRMASRKALAVTTLEPARTEEAVEKPYQPEVRERAPEVEVILATMDPARRAKLESIQARNLAVLAQTRDGREAIERLEARKNGVTSVTETQPMPTTEPPKPIVREVPMKVPFRLTGSQSGLMISELGPCQCGEQKLKWHAICIKVKVHG